MFTCYDSIHGIGNIDFDPDLIAYWERQPQEIKYIWYMANLYAIAIGKLRWEDLEPYRKDYKQGERYKKFMQKNPHHEMDLNNFIVEVKCEDMF